MKKGFYLFLGMLILGSILLGCSDDDKTIEPEPDPVPPVVEPEEPIIDSVDVICFGSFEVYNYSQDIGLEITEKIACSSFTYDTLGYVSSFRFEHGIENIKSDSVSVSWANQQVIMKYYRKGTAEEKGSATYTLNNKGFMEKVVLKETGAADKTYEMKYTDNGIALYEGSKRLYSAAIETGGTYGNWTVTQPTDENVTVKVGYEDFTFESYTGIKNQCGLDLLTIMSYAGWLMPDCIFWAHVATLLPGSTQFYVDPKITYASQENAPLYETELYDYSENKTRVMISFDTYADEWNETAIYEDQVWKSLPSASYDFTQKRFGRVRK